MGVGPRNPGREGNILVADVDNVDAKGNGTHDVRNCKQHKPHITASIHRRIRRHKLTEV